MSQRPVVNRAALLGLVLLAFGAGAALCASALRASHPEEATAMAWGAWWSVVAGAAVAVLGLVTGGVFGLLRDEPR